MQPEISALLNRYAAGRYKPATFLERGVAVPFTTPYLMGGRIRPGERRAPELVLPNPAGASGVYIMPWSALPEVCALTLHDRAIWSQVSALQLLTPRTVQGVSRRVAAEGYAGRKAAQAAASANEMQEQQRVLVHYHLLLELVRQGEPPGNGLPPPERDSPANVERRARAVLEQLKNANSLPPQVAVEALEELAMAYEGCGLRNNPTGSRLPQLCNEMAEVMRQMAVWGDAGAEQEHLCARLLAQAAELTLRCARISLGRAHELLANLWALVHQWRNDPSVVLTLIERAEWLLDGWDTICGLWRATEPAHRLQAAIEMASLVPMIPSEVRDWVGFDAAGDMDGTRDGLRTWRRTVKVNQDWMTGRMVEAVARNEAVRALAA